MAADRSERYVLIVSASSLTTEYRVLPMDDPEGDFEVLWPREPGVEYNVDVAVLEQDGKEEERWVVTHNAHGPNSSVGVCAAGAELPPLRELTELMPHSDEVRIEGTDSYRDFIFAAYRRGGIGRLAVADLTGGEFGAFRELEFDEELYTAGLAGNPEWDAPVVRISYTLSLIHI